jgi:fatty-acyl-CoA synthase
MKYGFSTLGCPEWQWDEILSAASDLGFDGLELRGIGNEIYLPDADIFRSSRIAGVVADIARLGLSIPCLASGALLCAPGDDAFHEADAYIRLASSLGAPYVRLLADKDPAPGIVDESAVVANLTRILPLAEKNNVAVLIETNGVFAESSRLKNLCSRFDSPFFGVVWDIHHPFRFFGEDVAETYRNLRPFIRHVHAKDSLMTDDVLTYRMTGHGDVPLGDALRLLSSDGFNGFVVLEWVRRWYLNLESPGIVLPHFLEFIRKLQP